MDSLYQEIRTGEIGLHFPLNLQLACIKPVPLINRSPRHVEPEPNTYANSKVCLPRQQSRPKKTFIQPKNSADVYHCIYPATNATNDGMGQCIDLTEAVFISLTAPDSSDHRSP